MKCKPIPSLPVHKISPETCICPGTFGKVAIQSPVLDPPLAAELLPLLESVEPRPDVYLERRRSDYHEGFRRDVREHSERLLGHLETAGYEVRVRELAGSWNWPSWRAQLGEILELYFPPATDQ